MAEETPQSTPSTPSTTPEGQPPAVRPAMIGVRPMAFKPATPAAGAAPAAGPSTIRLKPVVTPPAAPVPPPAAGADGIAPTVRVRPVIPPQTTGGAPQPGSAPLPPGPKPLKPEQIQAAKAKTSRISLDAALIGGQDDRGGPKTIRLKRPSDAPVGKITSHLGAAAAAATGQPTPTRSSSRVSSALIPPVPSEPSAPVVNRFTTSVETPDPTPNTRRSTSVTVPDTEDTTAKMPSHGTARLPEQTEESSITRRKTIRVKRPGAPVAAAASAPSGEGETSEAGDASDTAPLATTESREWRPAERMNPFFPVLAVLTLFVMVALVLLLLVPDRQVSSSTTWPPNSPMLKLPGMAPVPGRN